MLPVFVRSLTCFCFSASSHVLDPLKFDSTSARNSSAFTYATLLHFTQATSLKNLNQALNFTHMTLTLDLHLKRPTTSEVNIHLTFTSPLKSLIISHLTHPPISLSPPTPSPLPLPQTPQPPPQPTPCSSPSSSTSSPAPAS